jgi:hypothetical protein
MSRSTTIRLPGTDGPDIVVERRAFSKPRVTAEGREIGADPSQKDRYSIVALDGTTRSFTLKSQRGGLAIVADDGHTFAIDPPRAAWEFALAFLPIGLVAVGGLIGGVIGGVAAAANLAISRSDLRAPLRVGAMLAITGVAAIAFFGVARVISTALIPTYAVGQCVEGIGTGTTINAMAIRTTACTNPHQGEVVGIHALAAPDDGTPFPGLATVESAADERCPPLFESYIGVSFDESRLEMFYLYPSEQTWGQGDRQIACIATGTGGERLTGTLAGSAQ